MVVCAAYGCNSRSGRDKVGFFKFPLDKTLKKVWLDRLSRDFRLNCHSRLCGLHFEERCFVRSDFFVRSIGFTGTFKKHLKTDAVPTLRFHRSVPGVTDRPRPSAVSLSRKRKKLELYEPSQETATVSSSEEIYIATPITQDENIVMSDACPLATLATLSAERAPLPIVATFEIQCQTPRWAVHSKEVQTQSTLVDAATQTDWATDVPVETTRPVQTPNTSFASDVSSMPMVEDDDEDDDDESWAPDTDSDDEDELDDFDDSFTCSTSERRFIVFESQLDILLLNCQLCNRPTTVTKTINGAQLKCTIYCEGCCDSRQWTSQPSSGTLAVGHIELAAAIMFSGSGPFKMLRALQFANITVFKPSTYFQLQKAYIAPAIRRVWSTQQEDLIRAMEARPTKLGGDARCCSPGHTAKYGSYSMMDLDTGKIVDMQLVQSSEVKNSYAMELEGLKRSLTLLTEVNSVPVSHLVTDRHSSIKKFMREERGDIVHWFDVWHVAKGVYKKLEAASKKKGCDKVKSWARSVSNHLYWCAASSDGDGELVQHKWLSILNHVANIHEGHGARFPRCLHEPIERLWMKPGCKPHDELEKIVKGRLLVQDIKKLSPAQQTSALEAFHSVVCHFVPKSTHYAHSYMEARLVLAVLHFNENGNRPQATTKDGTKMFAISYPKARRGEPVAKEVKTCQTFGYVGHLMKEVMLLRESNRSYTSAMEMVKVTDKVRPKPLSHSTPRRGESREAIISAHQSRFVR